MLTYHPDAYLYGALVGLNHIYKMTKESKFRLGYYERAKKDIIDSNERDRHSGVTPTTRIDYGLY